MSTPWLARNGGAGAADLLGQLGAELGGVHLAGVLLHDRQVVEEHGAGLVDHVGQDAEGGQHGHVVGVVVHHDAGVGADAVQLGVDVDGGGHVPPAAGDPPVGVDLADVGGRHLTPPQAPGVDQHPLLTRALPGDVAGQVLGEAVPGQDPEGARQLLVVAQVHPDGRGHGW